MEKVDTLLVDKTGTLTEGTPRVVTLVAASGFTEDDVLRLAAGLERGSEHPLAGAILEDAGKRGITPKDVEDFESVTGQGVTAVADGRRLALGNLRLMPAEGVDLGGLTGRAESGRAEGQTVIFLAVDGRSPA